jgi:predicted HTH domain antitoxin
MVSHTLSLDLPEEVVALLGSSEQAAARARETLILDLLRRGQISQGKAAELLGVTRWAVLDLMAEHGIETGPEGAEELAQELATVRRVSDTQRAAKDSREESGPTSGRGHQQ